MLKNVAVIGGGILGSQISFWSALKGFSVVVVDVDQKALNTCSSLHKKYIKQFGAGNKKAIPDKICYSTNLDDVKHCEIIIESVVEDIDVKKSVFKKVSDVVASGSIICTNTSTFLPSELKDSVENSGRFLALHFANPLWEAKFAEIMPHEDTDKDVLEKTIQFVKKIELEPVVLKKEHRGYVINALLIPWLSAAQRLYFEGIVNFEEIDKVWKLATKSQLGPFEIMDIIGLHTIYNIIISDAKKYDSRALFERAEKLKKEFLDKGRKGRITKAGFYNYSDEY